MGVPLTRVMSEQVDLSPVQITSRIPAVLTQGVSKSISAKQAIIDYILLY